MTQAGQAESSRLLSSCDCWSVSSGEYEWVGNEQLLIYTLQGQCVIRIYLLWWLVRVSGELSKELTGKDASAAAVLCTLAAAGLLGGGLLGEQLALAVVSLTSPSAACSSKCTISASGVPSSVAACKAMQTVLLFLRQQRI